MEKWAAEIESQANKHAICDDGHQLAGKIHQHSQSQQRKNYGQPELFEH